MKTEEAGMLTIKVLTSLPFESDNDINEQCDKADEILIDIEKVLSSLYGKGGQFEKKGFELVFAFGDQD